MSGIEIVILIVGVIFVLGSFFVGEKFSSKDVEQIAMLSKEQLNRIVEKELQHAGDRIQNTVDDTIENSVMKIERMMDKEANQKMMSISEYSDTVLAEINKAHSEVMFLYSMLNDKYQEMTDMSNQINAFISDAEKVIHQQTNLNQQPQEETMILPENSMDETTVIDIEKDEDGIEEDKNQNHRILTLAQDGLNAIDIAKQLNVGIGEVRFVLDLYKGESME